LSLRVTILGCGSSGGVPRVGSGWGACDPAEPRNRRRRCSIFVEQTGLGERTGEAGTTTILVDTSPDLREQLLDAGVKRLDAVLYTHEHADHTHGIDDLRGLVLTARRRVPVHLDEATATMMRARFLYCFETPPGGDYPPIVDEHRLHAGTPVRVDGPAARSRRCLSRWSMAASTSSASASATSPTHPTSAPSPTPRCRRWPGSTCGSSTRFASPRTRRISTSRRPCPGSSACARAAPC